MTSNGVGLATGDGDRAIGGIRPGPSLYLERVNMIQSYPAMLRVTICVGVIPLAWLSILKACSICFIEWLDI